MKRIVVPQGRDELGLPEEFTAEVGILVGEENVAHLADDGLPKPGVFVKAGMVLIGKWGCRKEYQRSLVPKPIEFQWLPPSELAERMSTLVEDRSYYVSSDEEGTVVSAYFQHSGDTLNGVVEIEK
jgi:DNA-directed RNA polymerase beta subunit